MDLAQVLEIASCTDPGMVRSHNEGEAALLPEETGGKVFVGEQELAASMTRHVMETLKERAAAH